MPRRADPPDFTAELEHLEQALAQPTGIRIPFAAEGDAIQYRLRLHQARRADRGANAEIYDPPHAMHNRSEFDRLVIRLRWVGPSLYLYLEHNTMGEPEPITPEGSNAQRQLPDSNGGEVEGTDCASGTEVRAAGGARRVV